MPSSIQRLARVGSSTISCRKWCERWERAPSIGVNLTENLLRLRAKPFYHLSLGQRPRYGLGEEIAGCRPASVDRSISRGAVEARLQPTETFSSVILRRCRRLR